MNISVLKKDVSDLANSMTICAVPFLMLSAMSCGGIRGSGGESLLAEVIGSGYRFFILSSLFWLAYRFLRGTVMLTLRGCGIAFQHCTDLAAPSVSSLCGRVSQNLAPLNAEPGREKIERQIIDIGGNRIAASEQPALPEELELHRGPMADEESAIPTIDWDLQYAILLANRREPALV